MALQWVFFLFCIFFLFFRPDMFWNVALRVYVVFCFAFPRIFWRFVFSKIISNFKNRGIHFNFFIHFGRAFKRFWLYFVLSVWFPKRECVIISHVFVFYIRVFVLYECFCGFYMCFCGFFVFIFVFFGCNLILFLLLWFLIVTLFF